MSRAIAVDNVVVACGRHPPIQAATLAQQTDTCAYKVNHDQTHMLSDARPAVAAVRNAGGGPEVLLHSTHNCCTTGAY